MTVLYSEVVRAARETVKSLLQGRVTGGPEIIINTLGGPTASVQYAPGNYAVVMQLPSLPGDADLTRGEADRVVALVAHECCHVLHTDFSVRKGIAPELFSMLNWVEDARIEAKELARGKAAGLLDLWSGMEAYDYWRAAKSREQSGAPPIGAIKADFGGVLATLARVANGYTIPGHDKHRANMPAFALPVLDDALRAIPGLKNTSEALALARDILARLNAGQAKAPAQPPPALPPPPQPPQGDDQGEDEAPEGDQGEDEAPEGDQGEDEAPEGDQGKGEAPEGDQGEDEAPEGDQGEDEAPEGDQGEDEAPEGKGEGESEDKAAPAQPQSWADGSGGGAVDDLSPQARQAAMMNELRERENVRPNASAQSAVLCFDGCEATPIAGRDRDPDPKLEARLRALLPAPGILRDQITRLIRSEERHGTERYRSTGRLDRRALTRMQTGQTNVFSRRVSSEGVDTAIIFLIDASGSMSGPIDVRAAHAEMVAASRERREPNYTTRADVARILGLHLAEAAENARGRCAVVLFTGGQNMCELKVAKPFDGPLDATGLAGMGDNSSTPLAVSILGAADLLRAETASRRILIALTDGDDDLGAESVKAAVRVTEARGVECVGIGCGINVGYAFPRAVNVMDLKNLPEKGLSALVDMLTPEDDR